MNIATVLMMYNGVQQMKNSNTSTKSILMTRFLLSKLFDLLDLHAHAWNKQTGEVEQEIK